VGDARIARSIKQIDADLLNVGAIKGNARPRRRAGFADSERVAPCTCIPYRIESARRMFAVTGVEHHLMTRSPDQNTKQLQSAAPKNTPAPLC